MAEIVSGGTPYDSGSYDHDIAFRRHAGSLILRIIVAGVKNVVASVKIMRLCGEETVESEHREWPAKNLNRSARDDVSPSVAQLRSEGDEG